MTHIWKYLISFFCLFLLASSGVAAQEDDVYFLIKKNFNIFSKTYESIALEYVDEVDPEILMRNGIDAMLETLDPYTVLYDESQNEKAEIFSRGNYAGVGIDAGYKNGNVVVIAPVDGGPAQKAGIRAGDVIVAVDGISTEHMQPEELNILTSGEEGSKVILTIHRYGVQQAQDYQITRERIETSNIGYAGLIGSQQNIGYIKLVQFGSKSADEFRTALMELQTKTELTGLVLDMRDNPGGILQEAVAIIDKFVEPGITVVETRGRIAEYNQAFATEEPVMFDKPLVILINQGSASASEVVAGTMQDLDRALIMGERSFGKGLVQIVKPMPYNTSLKMTISRYYIPSGRSIQSIQYTHMGRNSGVVHKDSIRKEFKTRNGRIVYESSGIEPDVNTQSKKESLLTLELMKQNIYFDFATRFKSRNKDFNKNTLPDEVYESFLVFLNEKEFSYQTNAEKTLSVLAEQLNPSPEVEHALDQIKKTLQQQKEQDLKRHENEIRNTLFLEITSRYHGQKGKLKANLNFDNEIEKAINFITHKDRMLQMLSGQ